MEENSLMIDAEDPEQVSNYVMKQGNGVKGLAELGISRLSKQYIQPLSERPSSFTLSLSSIPVIDFSMPDVAHLEASICAAAEKFGFFQIINHEVPLKVLEKVKEVAVCFFELPVEEKRKYLKENSQSNHVKYGTSFNSDKETTLEWKDYLTLLFVSHQDALALWPPACRDDLLDYMERCDVLIKTLMSLLMKGLKIPALDSKMESMLMGSKRINLNFYPKCPNPDLTVGVGRHSDVPTLTVLLQDDQGGLYVRLLDDKSAFGSWVHVSPIQGALVINVGDALEIISNGKYKSAEHRVVVSGSANRVSVPIFVGPGLGDVIGPLDHVLATTGEKPKYKKMLYSEYVSNFFRNVHNGKDSLKYAAI